MNPVSKQYLPQYKQIYYDHQAQTFGYTYENGNLAIVGNNLNMAIVPLEGVVARLSDEVQSLRREIDELKATREESN